MKRSAIMAVFMASFVSFLITDAFAEAPYRIKWGGVSPRIGSFAYLTAMARAVNKELKGEVSISPMETGGFLDNILRLRKRLVHCGLTHNLAAYACYQGVADFKDKKDDQLRSLWGGYVAPVLQVAIKGRGINSIYDLHGKPYVFSPGTTGGRLSDMFLESLGIRPNYKLMGISSGIDAMKSGMVDAFYRIGPLDSSILEIQSTMEVVFLPVSKEDLEKFEKAWPKHALEYILPANTYKGQTEPVPCLAYVCGDYSHTKVPEDVIYKIVKATYKHRKEIAESVPITRDGNWVDMWNNTAKYTEVPLHKGAVKAWRELGFNVPDKLIPPEAR
ncbi:MAG: TAXI family TRAP transporter solute-binding subunit [Deltaproteobacteria bacterium]|nr:TAXI family TRAP transporter solute-binding subunit [Deltaproteobacteria bacterium]